MAVLVFALDDVFFVVLYYRMFPFFQRCFFHPFPTRSGGRFHGGVAKTPGASILLVGVMLPKEVWWAQKVRTLEIFATISYGRWETPWPECVWRAVGWALRPLLHLFFTVVFITYFFCFCFSSRM